MALDRTKSGTIWVDSGGARYVEVARVEGGVSEPTEVQLSPEDAPALRGWWNAAELRRKGLREADCRNPSQEGP